MFTQPPAEGRPFNEPVADRALVACRHCDLLQRLPELAQGASARCPRCDEELHRHRVDSLDRTLALGVAAAILYVVANSVPMLGLSVVGNTSSTTVIGGVEQLWRDDQKMVAVLVALTVVIAPAIQIAFALAVALGGRRARPPRWVGVLLRHQPRASTWSMLEVMLLGVLVALVKIADYATVIPGFAMYALGALVFVFAAIQAFLDPREVWERIAWADEEATVAHGDTVGART